MSRSLALVSLSLSLVAFGCSNTDTTKKPPGVGPDMATGTGGNDGPDMAMAANTSGDMAGPMLPDLSGLPPADHDPTQHPPVPRMSSVSAASTITAPEIWTVVWQGDEALGAQVNTFTTWML